MDVQGSLVFRKLAPGKDYLVKTKTNPPEQSKPLTVMSIESSKPTQDSYAGQELKAGFNYLTMRDGTTLSAWVTLPRGRGPFPTVVNYSGYDASRPQPPEPRSAPSSATSSRCCARRPPIAPRCWPA